MSDNNGNGNGGDPPLDICQHFAEMAAQRFLEVSSNMHKAECRLESAKQAHRMYDEKSVRLEKRGYAAPEAERQLLCDVPALQNELEKWKIAHAAETKNLFHWLGKISAAEEASITREETC